MSGNPRPTQDDGGKRVITVLLVDDMMDTRESIKKLLSFEPDFKVIGTAATGREGVEMTRQLEPDVVIMDINMPDMDGLEASSRITKSIWKTGIIIMSVQDDSDYIQRAMMAGARNFLPKPANMDKLYSTIRSVYEQMAPMRMQWEMIKQGGIPTIADTNTSSGGDRAGHIIVTYSPQGGSGVTTIATSLASGLMKNGSKTLLIDANMEFGDVAAFLDIRAQQTLVDAIESATDLDAEYFDHIVTTHNSGIRVLPAPPRPSVGEEIRANSPHLVAELVKQIRGYYDFIVIDTAKSLYDQVTANLLTIATKIVLVVVPTLPCIKNMKLVLDIFDQDGITPERTSILINKNPENNKKGVNPAPEKIQTYLRRPIDGIIPLVDENFILSAINRGVPVIASDRDTNKAPIKQLLKYSEFLYATLTGEGEPQADASKEKRSSGISGISKLFGSR